MDLSKMNISSYIPAMPYKVRELLDKATNLVMNYTDAETKVVEATNDEPWGPSGKLLQDLSQLSYSSELYNEVMGMLWKRCFGQDKKCWRRIYKSLLVLSYLIKNGSKKVAISAREHLYDLRGLESFTYHDEQNKDQGINVRHKAKELIEFLHDDDRIRNERKRARANRDKYIGMSSESAGYRSNEQTEGQSRRTKDYTADGSDEDDRKTKSIWKNNDKDQFKDDQMTASFTRTRRKSRSDVDSNLTDPKLLASFAQADTDALKGEPLSAKLPINTATPSMVPEAPMIDLLGDDVNFQSLQDDEFGLFQEATSPYNCSVPSSAIQPSLWPASTDIFDPLASPSDDLNLFQIQTPSNPQSNVNIWSSVQGKLDISLNNLIPHTRGDPQKSSLPLNQFAGAIKK